MRCEALKKIWLMNMFFGGGLVGWLFWVLFGWLLLVFFQKKEQLSLSVESMVSIYKQVG